MRGGLSIQKLDSQTGTTPQGDASLEGISFELSTIAPTLLW